MIERNTKVSDLMRVLIHSLEVKGKWMQKNFKLTKKKERKATSFILLDGHLPVSQNVSWQWEEGREGVKWELGFAFFGVWEMGFCALGLGFMKQKQ